MTEDSVAALGRLGGRIGSLAVPAWGVLGVLAALPVITSFAGDEPAWTGEVGPGWRSSTSWPRPASSCATGCPGSPCGVTR